MADPRRRTFGPVVLLGLATAGLAAVAGNRAWVRWSAEREGPGSLLRITGDDSATVPLAGALALVLLACWGVVLVTRGRVRRAVAGLGLRWLLGMVLTAVLGLRSATDGLRDDLAEAGVADLSDAVGGVVLGVPRECASSAWPRPVWRSGWHPRGPRWAAGTTLRAPERGAAGRDPDARQDTKAVDLWRALDEGRDPTLTDHRPPDP